jgi:hypothetical protein
MSSEQLSILEMGAESNERWSKDTYNFFLAFEYYDESLDKLILKGKTMDTISATHLLY